MYVILTSKTGQFTTEIGADLEPVETFDYLFCGAKRAQFVIARLLRDTKVKIVDASVPPVVNLVPSKFLPRFDSIEKARKDLEQLVRYGSLDTALVKL